jgi:uncharacterized membrane protein YiaA
MGMEQDDQDRAPFQPPESVSVDVIADEVGIDAYHDAATTLLRTQLDTINSLTTKANTALSVGSAVLPLTLGILRAIDDDPSTWVLSFVCLAAAAYVMLVGFWFAATSSRALAQTSPDLTEMSAYLESGEYHGYILKLWTANAYHEATDDNARSIRARSEYIAYAEFALIAECGLLAIGGVLSLALS